MSLDTLITSSLLEQPKPTAHRETTALVLMGGGARTAYQAGVLKALAAMLRRATPDTAGTFPFQLMVGTSAGALNVTYMASQADQGLDALPKLASFWQPCAPSMSIASTHPPGRAPTNWWLAGP
jgi:NTE family protein